MSNFPRREISEILEIANREPDVVSVFVEGKFDKDLLEKYLRVKGLDQIVSVYTIDTIDVPNQLLSENRLTIKSNKSRVVGLSIEVSKSSADTAMRTPCIVDADCDRELGELRNEAALRYTDFTCMEMYGFDSAILTEICKFSLNINDAKIVELVRLMDEVLPTLFAVRCCNEELGLSGVMPAIASGFGKKKGGAAPTFSSEKYLNLFISQNKFSEDKQRILELFASKSQSLSSDIRNKAHGHDAVRLFYLYLGREKILSLSDDEIEKVGNRILLSGIDFSKLDLYPLFGGLLVHDISKKIN